MFGFLEKTQSSKYPEKNVKTQILQLCSLGQKKGIVMVYDIHLDTFEGPLDLLLHLIKKSDLEINGIKKIAEITDECLAYLDLM
jgi:hypothetical protein